MESLPEKNLIFVYNLSRDSFIAMQADTVQVTVHIETPITGIRNKRAKMDPLAMAIPLFFLINRILCAILRRCRSLV